MQCVNGHPLEPGQQFCAVCGQQAAAPPAPPPPAFGAAPSAPPPVGGFGPPPAPAAPEPGPPPAAVPPPSGPPPSAPPPSAFGASAGAGAAQVEAQLDAQAAKWAPAKRQLLAAALVVAAALVDLGAFIGALTLETGGISGAWKFRLHTLSGSADEVGVMLVVAAFLAAPLAGDAAKAADLGKKVVLGVLAVAAYTALTILLGFLADLGTLGDSFGQTVSLILGHLAALVLVAGAAAGAMMARSGKG